MHVLLSIDSRGTIAGAQKNPSPSPDGEGLGRGQLRSAVLNESPFVRSTPNFVPDSRVTSRDLDGSFWISPNRYPSAPPMRVVVTTFPFVRIATSAPAPAP